MSKSRSAVRFIPCVKYGDTGVARQLRASAPHAHAHTEKVKRIFDLCCDAAGFIDAQQFWTLSVQIDGQMTKEEFKYAAAPFAACAP